MFSPYSKRYARLPTSTKLLISLNVALMPIGALLIWSATYEVREARHALEGEALAQMLNAARATESLVGRNALALRIAANGAIDAEVSDPCANAAKSLQIAPAVTRDFTLSTDDGTLLCDSEAIDDDRAGEHVPAGGIDLWIDHNEQAIMLRVGVADGVATSRIGIEEIREVAEIAGRDLSSFAITDGERTLNAIPRRSSQVSGGKTITRRIDIANGQLAVVASDHAGGITLSDGLLIFLPVLMWVAAMLVSLMVVSTLLLQPLKRLRQTISAFDPRTDDLVLPDKLGTSEEIKSLGDSFIAAVKQIRESESAMAVALEGQRKLVREVHHRVKNNLQVVASLLNIHSRSAVSDEDRAAYTCIGRRVEALAVVHRNHFAEVEESRGIALRPLLTELGGSLRASALEPRKAAPIELDLDSCSTTQNVAAAVAFLVTEVVEFAFDSDATAPIEIALRRASELTARLSVSSDALVDRKGKSPDRSQFERIIEGLARQLRSPVEKRLGSYAVEIPVFPAD